MISIRRSTDSPTEHGVHIYDHDSNKWAHLGGLTAEQAKVISETLPLRSLTITVGPKPVYRRAIR